MDAATYRIGPSDFFTPGDLQSDADLVNDQVVLLDAFFEGNEAASAEWTDTWAVWSKNWRAFYNDHFGGWFSSLFSALNDSNRDELIRFEKQLVEWNSRVKAAGGGHSMLPDVAPSEGSGDTLGKHVAKQTDGLGLPSLTTIIIAALVLLGLVVAWRKA